MASIPARNASPSLSAAGISSIKSLKERFERLAVEWEQATGFLSSMEAASEHPAYQEIIGLS